MHQGALTEQAMTWYPERNFNSPRETSVLGYSSTSRAEHTPRASLACEQGSADQHQGWGQQGEKDQKVLEQQHSHSSGCQGAVETSLLCWEQGVQVTQQGQGWPGKQSAALPGIPPKHHAQIHAA